MSKAVVLGVVGASCVITLVVGLVLGLRCKQIPLGMSMDSVDDQYLGCDPNRAPELINSGNIPLPKDYSETWETAKQHWEKCSPNVSKLKPIYGTAIVAYTVGDSLYSDFNAAARGAGKSQDSYGQYAFKDFHLLLTKALQEKKTKPGCFDVFRGISKVCFNIAEKATVRFGQFASSSTNKTEAEKFGQDTFFFIKTCHGVSIEDISYKKEQKEVLIPPYEQFLVTKKEGPLIWLESQGVYSRFNCEAWKEL